MEIIWRRRRYFCCDSLSLRRRRLAMSPLWRPPPPPPPLLLHLHLLLHTTPPLTLLYSVSWNTWLHLDACQSYILIPGNRIWVWHGHKYMVIGLRGRNSLISQIFWSTLAALNKPWFTEGHFWIWRHSRMFLHHWQKSLKFKIAMWVKQSRRSAQIRSQRHTHFPQISLSDVEMFRSGWSWWKFTNLEHWESQLVGSPLCNFPHINPWSQLWQWKHNLHSVDHLQWIWL